MRTLSIALLSIRKVPEEEVPERGQEQQQLVDLQWDKRSRQGWVNYGFSKLNCIFFQLLNIKMDKGDMEAKFHAANTERGTERKEVSCNKNLIFLFKPHFSDFGWGRVCCLLLQPPCEAGDWQSVCHLHQGVSRQNVSRRSSPISPTRAEGRGNGYRRVPGDNQVRLKLCVVQNGDIIRRNFEPTEDKTHFSSQGFMHFLTFSDMQANKQKIQNNPK